MGRPVIKALIFKKPVISAGRINRHLIPIHTPETPHPLRTPIRGQFPAKKISAKRIIRTNLTIGLYRIIAIGYSLVKRIRK